MEDIKKNDYLVVNNAEELLSALKNKDDYIIIQEDFKKEFEENTQLPLSEKEQIGFHLGFGGTGGIWEEITFLIVNGFSKESKQQKHIDRKIRRYNLKKLNDGEILLSLRDLED